MDRLKSQISSTVTRRKKGLRRGLMNIKTPVLVARVLRRTVWSWIRGLVRCMVESKQALSIWLTSWILQLLRYTMSKASHNRLYRVRWSFVPGSNHELVVKDISQTIIRSRIVKKESLIRNIQITPLQYLNIMLVRFTLLHPPTSTLIGLVQGEAVILLRNASSCMFKTIPKWALQLKNLRHSITNPLPMSASFKVIITVNYSRKKLVLNKKERNLRHWLKLLRNKIWRMRK